MYIDIHVYVSRRERESADERLVSGEQWESALTTKWGQCLSVESGFTVWPAKPKKWSTYFYSEIARRLFFEYLACAGVMHYVSNRPMIDWRVANWIHRYKDITACLGSRRRSGQDFERKGKGNKERRKKLLISTPICFAQNIFLVIIFYIVWYKISKRKILF